MRTTLLYPDAELSSPVLDSNIEYVKARTQKANRSTLQDCFDLYFREERVSSKWRGFFNFKLHVLYSVRALDANLTLPSLRSLPSLPSLPSRPT